jgi:cytochrome b
MMKIIRIWDLPIRVFHWLLVICITGSVVSVKIGGNAMQWHAYFGYSILTLLIFRIIWGFVGSTYARFTAFSASPTQIVQYLREQAPRYLGHNPLGSLSIFILLLSLSIQALTGLFADDEIAFQGPFAKYVSSAAIELLSSVHDFNQYVIYGLIGLHIAAIMYYYKFKHENLLMPMLLGDKQIDPSELANYLPADLERSSRDDLVHRSLALLIVSVIVVVVAYSVTA